MDGAPDLESRFLETAGWRWHSLSRAGRNIRFGSVLPENAAPRAMVFILPGLSEFCEKYFETANQLVKEGYGVCVHDWMGQGQSGRYLEDRQKRHGVDFHEDVLDFLDITKKFSSTSPKIMLGSSMGGNIGLRVLAERPEMFSYAILSAPLCDLHGMAFIPKILRGSATSFFNIVSPEHYIPQGGAWTPETRKNTIPECFSADPKRRAVHNAWFSAIPDLQVGDATYGWLHHAQRSCEHIQDPDFLSSIQTACTIFTAEKEMLVCNETAAYIADALPNAQHEHLEESHHEIWMERDQIRNRIFEHLNNFAEENLPKPA